MKLLLLRRTAMAGSTGMTVEAEGGSITGPATVVERAEEVASVSAEDVIARGVRGHRRKLAELI